MDSIFRTTEVPEITAQTEPLPEPQKDAYSFEDEEPLDSAKQGQAVLNALGIDDLERNLSGEDVSNLNEVKGYVAGIIDKKGLELTSSNYKRVLDDLKADMGLDKDAAPEIVLDRIGGVVKAWRDISFISDPREKRSLFMKLAKQPDSKSMNKLVFQAMEEYKVWN